MTDSPAVPRQALRLWPGVVAAALGSFSWFVLPILAPGLSSAALVAGLAFGLLVILWWLFASRAPWLERLTALAVAIVAVAITPRFTHPSITFGMMGYMPFIYAVPVVTLALVVWAVFTRGHAGAARWMSMCVVLVLATGTLTLIRTNGLTGEADSDIVWRWSQTAEEKLLAAPAPAEPDRAPAIESASVPSALDAAPVETAATAAPAIAPPTEGLAAFWPGFRGRDRDSVVGGVRIDTNWITSPPVELWRHPIGPGWSSFAVGGNLIYTQEQRGDDELVSAYRVSTGEPVWRHRDAARFWESNAGAGPRGTPTLHDGRIYALGATGLLNALDARDGAVVWSRNAVADTRATVPDWGIASSPLVVGDMVVVATAGVLAAYDRATGTPRWTGPRGGWGYASPHLATVDGEPQIVLLNGAGAIGVAPSDGHLLWSHEWSGDGILQPVFLGHDLLVGSGSGLASAVGLRRLTLGRSAREWTVDERWTSSGLKPYFSDFVVHAGHAYGFDGSILASVDLTTGTRAWKGGRYGHGQLLLLAEQDLLLVLSEEGELALVKAAPDQFTEVGRVPAISGKTWNHPVLVGNTLLVRNGEEMAAFRLALVQR